MFLIVNNAIKLKFSEQSHNLLLNAVIIATKRYDYLILLNCIIPIDCHIDSNNNFIIITTC